MMRLQRRLLGLGCCLLGLFLLVPTINVLMWSHAVCHSSNVDIQLTTPSALGTNTHRDGGEWLPNPEESETLALSEHPEWLPNPEESETLALSEHPDIEIRGKFQKQQIKEFCNKHVFVKEHLPSDPPTAKLFFRHLIFEERTQSMFCFVPKIGCTNMKRLMLYMGGHLPLNTVDWPWVEDSKYLEPALKHASLMNVTLTQVQRLTMLHTYYKFMIVRNPLERIVSGYRNKIEPPLDFKKQDSFPHKIKKEILMRFQLREFLAWKQAEKSSPYNISVSFQHFVHYLIYTPVEDLNEHFQASMDICHPCVVDYDFYANFRNYSHDVQALIKKFKTDPRYYRDESLHSSTDRTAQVLPHYYNQLTFREKVKLLGVIYDELAFYYTLYPSERYHHVTLLGINVTLI